MIETRPCKQCRTPNAGTNVFCATCGSKVEAPFFTPGVTALVVVLALLLVGSAVASVVIVAGRPGVPAAAEETKPVAASPPNALAPAAPPAQPRPMTPAERLTAAKALLNNSGPYYLAQAEEHLSAVPRGAREHAEAQRLLKSAKDKQAEYVREQLCEDYVKTVSEANSHLNYIGKKITKTKGGYALYATHEYFSQFTLTIGDDAHVISAWIDRHDSELREAGIVRVGVMGKGEYASWGHFNIK